MSQRSPRKLSRHERDIHCGACNSVGHNYKTCPVDDSSKYQPKKSKWNFFIFMIDNALEPLAFKQQRAVQISELPQSLEVAVEDPALLQALSNLIEGALLCTNAGGMVEIVSTSAPAGGALIIIDDDGPDMHYMTQMHSLTPFGADILSKGMVEDNMTWNFVAGLTVAREILESYGCVVRVIFPRCMEAPLGPGGTRVEIWLPLFTSSPDGLDGSPQDP